MNLSVDGMRHERKVHQLVLKSFTEPPGGNQVTCHNNGDPADNRPENLRWGTPAKNSTDTKRHGRNHKLTRTYCLHGHEYTPENTSTYRGARVCRTCKRIRARQYRAQKKQDNQTSAEK